MTIETKSNKYILIEQTDDGNSYTMRVSGLNNFEMLGLLKYFAISCASNMLDSTEFGLRKKEEPTHE